MSILSVAAALVVTNLTPVVVTSASWTGEEWDHGAVSTLSCADDGSGSDFKTRGAGRLLGGEVVGLDLDNAAELKGITAKNNGEGSHADPATADETSKDTYENLFDMSALNAIELPVVEGALDRTLGSMLTLTPDPGSEGVGVVNHYARATDIGVSEGASGAVSDSGGLILTPESGSLPGLGTIKLSTLVQSLTGQAIADVVAGVTDLELEIGAVASRATLDACETAWTGHIGDPQLRREYAIAGLDAAVTAPTVSGLSSTLDEQLLNLETAVDGLAGNGGVVSAVTSGIEKLIGGLGLGRVSLAGTVVDVNLDEVRKLLTASVKDNNGTLELDVGTGEVKVDLAALLGGAYGEDGANGAQDHGLNGLAPNTELLLNGDVAAALFTALREALDNWVGDVLVALESAVHEAGVKIVVNVEVRALGIGLVNIELTGAASLENLLAGGVGLKAELTLLGLPCGLVCATLSGVVNALTAGVGAVVGQALESALIGTPQSKGLVLALVDTLLSATTPAVTLLSAVFNNILGANGLISLRVNVQNDPAAGDDPDPPLIYPEWEAAGSRPVPADQYDVAALSISLLDLAGTSGNINLELARSSVGVSCAVGGVWDNDGRCAGY